MAVLQMRRISIYGLKKNRKQILEVLQRCGTVEITAAEQEDSVFEKADMSSAQALFDKNITAAKQALEILDRYAPEKKSMLAMLEGRQEIPVNQYQAFEAKRDEIQQVVTRLNTLSKDIAESGGTVQKLETQIEALRPWTKLDVSMRYKGSRSTAAFIGTLAGGLTEPAAEELLAGAAPGVSVHVEVVSTSQEQTCVFLLCPKAQAQELEDALRSIGFSRPSSPSKPAPAEYLRELERRVTEAKQIAQDAEKEILSYAGQRRDMQFYVDYMGIRLEKYEVIGRLAQSKRTFVVSGYIPAQDAPKVEKELAPLGAAVELEEVSPEDDVPVLLKNNAFSAPVEGVLKSFSLPGKGEIDPSAMMAVFYYFLFGMMLSDAGYGLIMVIACGFALLKFKNMEQGMRKSLRMFFFCGISTTFWGFMYGSFFGDVIKVASTTFFGKTVTLAPLWFEPINEPMRLLMFSLLVGVIHVFVGLALSAYQKWKQGNLLDILYDVVFWYLLVGGAIVYLLSTQMFADIAQFDSTLPASVGMGGGIAAGIGAVGILLTGGRESRNPIKRLLKGAYALYNVTGYLSDILSYSRLLALGLATGVIAQVINQMGAMGGGGVVGAIMFVAVFLVGHTINIGINMLGAYVHTNRLQFVEFFGKFYEGGGHEFEPFGVHTKYYKFKEDK